MSIETCILSDDDARSFNLPLWIETVLVMVIAIGAIKIFDRDSAFVPAWLIPPGILIISALLPLAIKRDGFSQLGFNIDHLRDSLIVLGWTCISVLPLTFFGLWLLKSFGFDLFLRPVLPKEHGWISWLFYQFLYVALAEELFFRGYLQSHILRLTTPIMVKWPRRWQWISIGISAACFAMAHVIIQGHIVSALTFLPGLILGWLFIRTKSILAPILFHGLANTFYLAISVMFA
jgi:membrane protease YdiL (CAAX protease family)